MSSLIKNKSIIVSGFSAPRLALQSIIGLNSTIKNQFKNILSKKENNSECYLELVKSIKKINEKSKGYNKLTRWFIGINKINAEYKQLIKSLELDYVIVKQKKELANELVLTSCERGTTKNLNDDLSKCILKKKIIVEELKPTKKLKDIPYCIMTLQNGVKVIPNNYGLPMKYTNLIDEKKKAEKLNFFYSKKSVSTSFNSMRQNEIDKSVALIRFSDYQLEMLSGVNQDKLYALDNLCKR